MIAPDSVVMTTRLPTRDNTKPIPSDTEGETDVRIIPTTRGPMAPAVRQESRMRSNVSRELDALGFGKG